MALGTAREAYLTDVCFLDIACQENQNDTVVYRRHATQRASISCKYTIITVHAGSAEASAGCSMLSLYLSETLKQRFGQSILLLLLIDLEPHAHFPKAPAC